MSERVGTMLGVRLVSICQSFDMFARFWVGLVTALFMWHGKLSI